MKWYIGQEIVAIRDHSQGLFKKGDVFPIKGLKKSFCRCGDVNIDIGFHSHSLYLSCDDCNISIRNTDSVYWFSEECFAPLDFDISELTSILETPLELAHEQ